MAMRQGRMAKESNVIHLDKELMRGFQDVQENYVDVTFLLTLTGQ